MGITEFNVGLKNMRIKKLIGGAVFIHKIEKYEIWKVIVIDKTGTITSNFTFKDEAEANKKFDEFHGEINEF